MGNIFDLFLEEAHGDRWKILLIATIAGVSNMLVMAIANDAVESPKNTDISHFVLLVLVIAAYAACAKRTHHRISALAEIAHHKFKARVISKIEQAEYPQVEKLGISQLHERVSESGATVTQAAGMVANLLMSVSILIFTLLYIAYIAQSAVLVITLIFAAGAALCWRQFKTIEVKLRETAGARVSFLTSLSDLLDGFKELKFSRPRGKDVVAEAVDTSETLRDLSIATGQAMDSITVYISCVMFVILCVITFLFPAYFDSSIETIRHITTAVLFAWGPFLGIATGGPSLVRMNVAFDLLQKIERDIDQTLDEIARRAEDPWGERPERIELDALEFTYQKGDSVEREFKIGPIDLTIEAGEIVFIVGGNGSGKSTLFKVLTGLYPIGGGTLALDGKPVCARNLSAYRERISVIFTDFHLFQRLYGLSNVEPERVDRYLELMRIHDKTDVVDGRFTQLALSTGQRKRVAMVVALLEDRPIYAFDEWAADQDPEFRQYFYEEMLPMMKARGKTVIAVTHDDRYFHHADKVVTMEDGLIRSIVRAPEPLVAATPTVGA